MGSEILMGERNWETVDSRRVHIWELHGEWGIEWEGRYWWVRGNWKKLTLGECIVGSCMVSGSDWRLLGD